MADKPRPEDVTDEERHIILEQAAAAAAEQAGADRRRRVALGLVDEAGNILAPSPNPRTPTDDPGGL